MPYRSMHSRLVVLMAITVLCIAVAVTFTLWREWQSFQRIAARCSEVNLKSELESLQRGKTDITLTTSTVNNCFLRSAWPLLVEGVAYVRIPVLTDDVLGAFRGVSSLRAVDIESCEVSESALIGFLEQQKALEHIHIKGVKVSDSFFAALSRQRSLEVLFVTGEPIHITEVTGTALAPLTALTRLGVTLDEGSDIASLRHLPALEHLDISHSVLGNRRLQGVQSLIGLRSIDLSGCHITYEAAKVLKDLPLLESVRFDNTSLSNEELERFLMNDSLVSGPQL